MSALRKPHRIAFLVPELGIEGMDAAHRAETGLMLWAACIETCQRHPGLAVYEPESTPLIPRRERFAPEHATVGATPVDAFWSPTRRDELVWLELALPKTTVVRLHTLARDGKRQAFEATGRTTGDGINQVLGAWLTARGLGALPRRFEAVTGDEILAAVRIIAPLLVEQARLWTAPARLASISQLELAADRDDAAMLPATADDSSERVIVPPAKLSRPTANRLAAVLRVPTLRVLELALHEDLGDLILASDADHPQALFAKFLATAGQGKDFKLLRRVIAAAPCWARPYGELVAEDDDRERPLAPTDLETVAGAGIAALCRPGHLDVVERAAQLLRDDGRPDEAVRLMERVLGLYDLDSRAHIALLHLHRATDRVGVWLGQALRSGRVHGCPMDPQLPWYPDQIQIDLLVADALMSAGRLDEALALRANRLEGREATWPRHARVLAAWRKDPRFVARAYAREGFFRGDAARAVEGFGRSEPEDSVDAAIFLEALVAMGREDEVPFAWGQFGLGKGLAAPVARLAAARCLMAAGEWRRGLEELWRVELKEPGRDEQVAIHRCGLLVSCLPIDVAEAALAERVAVGAHALARRMARDIADFVPAASKSSFVLRALGMTGSPSAIIEFDPASLGGFAQGRWRKPIDALFAELKGEGDPLSRADRLVDRWIEVVFAGASEDDPAALAQAAAYTAANALGRYLAASTAPPSVLAGGLRTVAGEALALVRRHQTALGDREVRALLGVLEPLLRRVDRWIGASWLAAVERSCGIDERSAGDVAGFARDYATVAARILGPEETAVLSASVARLHRERLDGWETATAAQAARLALHTGHAGVDEWADATIAQLAAGTLELDDALDALHTASYLAEGTSAVPSAHAAKLLLDSGRPPAALAVLTAGLGAATQEQRDFQLVSLAETWRRVNPGIPLAADQVGAGVLEAIQKGEPARAEKLGRWAVALDPDNTEAHRNLGFALAQQGKIVDAFHHLVRGTQDQAPQLLSSVLYQTGKLAEAMTVLDYASRWYVRADQWLAYAGIAHAAADHARTAKAFKLAYRLDPDAFDATQLDAFAGVLVEVGDHATCEKVANELLRVAGDNLAWQTIAWHHLACANIGLGKFDHAIALAMMAVERTPVRENAGRFGATLELAKARMKLATIAPATVTTSRPREPVFALLEAGDFATAAALTSDSAWRVRRAALGAARFRYLSENDLEATPRARAAADALLVDTIGLLGREAVLCRMLALEVREQGYFARDPLPRLGDRMTRDAFYKEFRARGGVVLGEELPPAPPFIDRVIVPGAKVARASDYIALLRDLAALTPGEALAQFDLDHAGYVEVGRAWGEAISADPSIAHTIAAGLAKR